MTDKPKPKRRWLQFSLRTMFLVMTVFCIWIAITAKRARDQKLAVEAIREMGGRVFYEHQIGNPSDPLIPEWLRRFIGDEYFFSVNGIQLEGPDFDDASLIAIEQMTDAKLLALTDTKITDTGLVHLKGLTKVETLVLNGTQVTGTGMVHLKGLTKLGFLYLNNTQVSDAGLVHLKGFSNFQQLDLSNTRITDVGLDHLKGLTKLQTLNLSSTQVTDQGVKRLRQALPNCVIRH